MNETTNATIRKLVAGIADVALLLDGELPPGNAAAESQLIIIKKSCSKILDLLGTTETTCIIEKKEPEERYLFINEVTAVIERNISDFDFDANNLADMMSTSLITLNRKVKRAVGCSTTAYIRQLRLEKAKHLLEETDIPVTEIQALCGFDMLSYFSRLFKEQFGVSPLKYRNGLRRV